MKTRIYLDHAATTAVHPDVLAEMLPYFIEAGHNPSSLHAEGRRARAGLDVARDRVAAALGVATTRRFSPRPAPRTRAGITLSRRGSSITQSCMRSTRCVTRASRSRCSTWMNAG